MCIAVVFIVEHLLINGQCPVIGFDHPQDQIQFRE